MEQDETTDYVFNKVKIYSVVDFYVVSDYSESTLYKLLKPILFSLEPEAAHGLALGSLKLSRPFLSLLSPWLRTYDKRLEKTVFGLRFPNPIGLAAGLDKKGELTAAWEKV